MLDQFNIGNKCCTLFEHYVGWCWKNINFYCPCKQQIVSNVAWSNMLDDVGFHFQLICHHFMFQIKMEEQVERLININELHTVFCETYLAKLSWNIRLKCKRARLNESNIIQHVGPCNIWYALLLARTIEMFVQHHPTSSNIVIKRVQHFWTTKVGRCWSNMLDSFKRAFRQKPFLSKHYQQMRCCTSIN